MIVTSHGYLLQWKDLRQPPEFGQPVYSHGRWHLPDGVHTDSRVDGVLVDLIKRKLGCDAVSTTH